MKTVCKSHSDESIKTAQVWDQMKSNAYEQCSINFKKRNKLCYVQESITCNKRKTWRFIQITSKTYIQKVNCSFAVDKMVKYLKVK